MGAKHGPADPAKDDSATTQIDVSYDPETRALVILVNNSPPTANNYLGSLPVICDFDLVLEKLPRLLGGQYGNSPVRIQFRGSRVNSVKLARKLRWYNQVYNGKVVYKYSGEIQKTATPGKPAQNVDKPEPSDTVELETCVIATMSSGKSTLINAILGRQLLPSMQEACTSTIMRIRDDDELNGKGFAAKAIGRDGKIIKEIPLATQEDLRNLNKNPDVARVDMVGDIECVPSDNVALTLIDTPGPNNARDDSHRKIQEDQLSSGSGAIILYVLTPEFGNDDEWELLRRVIKSMNQGDARSQDRFLFVLNKVDERKREDGPLQKTLEDLRAYLRQHGIANPRIFPTAALPALMIRRLQNRDDNLDEEERETAEMYVRRLNRNSGLHLEKYAREFSGLPPLASALLEKEVVNLRKSWDARGGNQYSNPDEALSHTGILALEAAFLEYVLKYEKNAL